jgi:hypothetical protein
METVWVLHRDLGISTICSLTQSGHHSWMMTIAHGSVTVATEFFWTHDDAVRAARKIERGLIDAGWARTPDVGVGTKG